VLYSHCFLPSVSAPPFFLLSPTLFFCDATRTLRYVGWAHVAVQGDNIR
jgi:hypothetical protein